MFVSLDQPVLSALLEELFRGGEAVCIDCESGPGAVVKLQTIAPVEIKYCYDCAHHFFPEWHEAAGRVERHLLQSGWGCA